MILKFDEMNLGNQRLYKKLGNEYRKLKAVYRGLETKVRSRKLDALGYSKEDILEINKRFGIKNPEELASHLETEEKQDARLRAEYERDMAFLRKNRPDLLEKGERE